MLPGLELAPQCTWRPFLNISQPRYVWIFSSVLIFKVVFVGLERVFICQGCDFGVFFFENVMYVCFSGISIFGSVGFVFDHFDLG